MKAFAQELATYRAHLAEWLVHEGKYVVVRGDEIDGPFDEYVDALQAGFAMYGLEPFLVQQIHAVEPVHFIGHGVPVI